MNLSLNYFVEANLALCIFLVVYHFLLRNETSFGLKRIILLTGMMISLVFPAFHIQGSPLHLPTLSEVVPATLLPEMVVVGRSGAQKSALPSINLPQLIYYIYLAGAVVMLFTFLAGIFRLLIFIHRSERKQVGSLHVVQSPRCAAPFSFFNFVFIGESNDLTDHEKDLIMAHEAVHAKYWHTLDILFVEILRIFFWFNPVLKIYKNIFIQLHEFEADARSVRNEELGAYCNLVARVALLSADIRIANHFSNSLTLKRIQMMRTIKFKIRPWKVAAIALVVPAFFILLSCQDQMVSEATDIAKASTVAIDVPEEVQAKYDQLKSVNPELKLLLLEITELEESKIGKIQADIEKKGKINSVNLITPTAKESEPLRHFLIIEYDENVSAIAEKSKQDNVFTVVEESASPSGGINDFYAFLAKNISYPKESREKGVQGKVFVSFIVEADGALSDFQVVEGVSSDLDAEALRVVKLSPKWNPAKHEGAIVRQRMVLPINFLIEEKKENKVGYFSTPINPVEFLHPDRKNKC
jgi:TonB family protein